MRDFLAQTLADSPTREWSVYLLSNVPGLPPIAQSFHILGIAAVAGSILMVDLKFQSRAVPRGRLEAVGGKGTGSRLEELTTGESA